MNKKSIFSVIILFLVLSITIGFSAFASEMSISKIVADVRVKKDIRITDVSLKNYNFNGVEPIFDFDENSIILLNSFVSIGDSITFNVTVTNIGSVEVGLLNLVVPDGINYSIKNYTMGDKICDDSGKCSLGISKVFEISVSADYEFALNVENYKFDFDFRKVHSISYTNIYGETVEINGRTHLIDRR